MQTSIRQIRNQIYWKKKKHEINKKRRDIYKENPEIREQTYLRRQIWIAENPEKYLKQIESRKNQRLKFRFEILKRDGFKCVYCGAKPEQNKLHIDHVLPRSKGGLNIKSNLVTCCKECNLGKSDVLLTKR